MEKPLSAEALHLARFRELNGISRRLMSETLGCPASRIQDIERGKSSVDDAFLRTFWDAYQVDLTTPFALDHSGSWQIPPSDRLSAQGVAATPRLTPAAFGLRYRAAVHKVDTVLAEKGLKPNPLLYEALKTLVVTHDVSPESLALLIGGIEQQVKEAST